MVWKGMGMERQQVKEGFEIVITQNGQKIFQTLMQNFKKSVI